MNNQHLTLLCSASSVLEEHLPGATLHHLQPRIMLYFTHRVVCIYYNPNGVHNEDEQEKSILDRINLVSNEAKKVANPTGDCGLYAIYFLSYMIRCSTLDIIDCGKKFSGSTITHESIFNFFYPEQRNAPVKRLTFNSRQTKGGSRSTRQMYKKRRKLTKRKKQKKNCTKKEILERGMKYEFIVYSNESQFFPF